MAGRIITPSIYVCAYIRTKVLKQREEFEKKKAEEMEQLDNLEKARILSNFEKEHAAAQDVLDQDRKNKKAKLADRLQKYTSLCSFSSTLKFRSYEFMMLHYRRKSTIHQSLPTEDSKHLATIAERVPTGSEPTSVKVSKDKDAHASHSHSHRKSSKDGVDEIPVTSAVAQATAAAAQVAATQASSAAAAATVLQSSIKQIEGKLEKIEKVMLALEKNASPPTSTQLPVAVPPGGRLLPTHSMRKQIFFIIPVDYFLRSKKRLRPPLLHLLPPFTKIGTSLFLEMRWS